MPARPTDDGRTVPGVVHARSLTLRMARVNTASRGAREYLRTALTDVESDTLETVLLVTTELITNAVLHAEGPIDLTVDVGPEQLVVQVFDCEPLPPLQQDHDLGRTDGRGIALVSMVSSDWGTRYHDGGKTVWAVIPRE